MVDVIAQTPKLVVRSRGYVVKECGLTTSEFTIGRKPDNDLVIEDDAVSGHHAKIVKIQAVYFIEDLRSTNGTYVNGQKFERKQLRDADVVMLGKHRLVFLEEEKNVPTHALSAGEGSDQTVFLKSGGGPQSRIMHKVGFVQVISGRTDRKEYTLTNQVTIIGAQSDAMIKLTGFFAPKTAAIIGRRGNGYYVTVARRRKKIHVNHETVNAQADLKDGDLLEVAGVKMYFYLKDAA